MRVLVISKATRSVDDQKLPIDVAAKAAEFEAMGRFTEELTEAGIMVMGTGLKPSRFGKKVRFEGGKRHVTDGPFTETKELIASFSVWEVKSMEHALELVRRAPLSEKDATEIEIRPFLEMEDFDFGGAVPVEERASWEKMTGQEK
jgi:hypothetical protein